MASESVSVSGPVHVQPDSKERVAYELMRHIDQLTRPESGEHRTPDYWFRLYAKCHRLVVYGMEPKDIQQVK
ncbi:hypothetical protein SVA_0449 [Sulfurifustis variabilis]|uniref:Uncharacterized protein n=1 Tax=Sulfurifustis variabilis TaxID=1675686 RepID=A0A1B4V0Q1_9GAMM|nr:hypothetical protein SVA_0449 [Sulfurifustis variabilis]